MKSTGTNLLCWGLFLFLRKKTKIVIAFIRGDLVCSACSRMYVRWLMALHSIEYMYLSFSLTSHSNGTWNACKNLLHISGEESMSTASNRKIYCDSVQCPILAWNIRPAFSLQWKCQAQELYTIESCVSLRSARECIFRWQREMWATFGIAIFTSTWNILRWHSTRLDSMENKI